MFEFCLYLWGKNIFIKNVLLKIVWVDTFRLTLESAQFFQLFLSRVVGLPFLLAGGEWC